MDLRGIGSRVVDLAFGYFVPSAAATDELIGTISLEPDCMTGLIERVKDWKLHSLGSANCFPGTYWFCRSHDLIPDIEVEPSIPPLYKELGPGLGVGSRN